MEQFKKSHEKYQNTRMRGMVCVWDFGEAGMAGMAKKYASIAKFGRMGPKVTISPLKILNPALIN